MLNTIYQDDEKICKNCGCVLGQVDDTQSIYEEKSPIKPSLDVVLLGSAIDKAVRPSLRRTAKQAYEERVFHQLIHVAKKFGLPESFVIDTMNKLKKDKSGFRSELIPIKELVKILSKDENYIYNNKLRAIKQAYEISSM